MGFAVAGITGNFSKGMENILSACPGNAQLRWMCMSSRCQCFQLTLWDLFATKLAKSLLQAREVPSSWKMPNASSCNTMPQLGELYLAQSHEPNRRWLAVSTNENCWKVVSHYCYALDVICILVFCLQFCNGWMHKFNLSLLKHHLYQLWCTLLVFISQSLLFTLHSWLLQRLFSIPTYPWV